VPEQVPVLPDQVGTRAMAKGASTGHQRDALELAEESFLVGERLRHEVPHHEAHRADAHELELRHGVIRHPQEGLAFRLAGGRRSRGRQWRGLGN
jgi:hypothetical protein